MRVILAALILIAVVVVFWITQNAVPDIDAIKSGEPGVIKDLSILLVGLLLLVEGLIRKPPAKEAVRAAEPPAQPADDPEKQALASERDALRVALSDAERRLEAGKAEAALRARPENVEAEIVSLLSLFQEKGRFIDFLMEDIATYSDNQVGAAARVVHQGCSGILKEYFRIVPVFEGKEGENLTVEGQLSPRQYRLLGSVKGEPPFTGKVLHRGWRASEMRLPRVQNTEGADIIAPTEIQLQ